MSINNLSSVNQAYIRSAQMQNQQLITKPEQKKNGKKMLAIGAAAVAATAIAGIMLYKKGVIKFKLKPEIKSLSDVKVENKIVVLKENGKKFNGQLQYTLKDGSSVVNKYKDGLLQEHLKLNNTGASGVIKKHIRKNGEHIVESGTVGVLSNGNIITNMEKRVNLTQQGKFIQEALQGEPLKFDFSNAEKDTGIELVTANEATGFSWYDFGCRNSDGHSFKKTKDGVIWLKPKTYSYQDGIMADKNKECIGGLWSSSSLGKLTDIQKALLACDIQNLECSPNSPIGKLYSDMSKKEVIDMISKWSKDIDLTDPKTRITLAAIENMPEGSTCDNKSLKYFLSNLPFNEKINK